MKHQVGNIIDLKQGVILQQVNALGRMNSGVAKDIREKWPAVWDAYHRLDQVDGLGLGGVHTILVEPGLWVVNIVGQHDYGRDGRKYTSYDALDEALVRIAGWLDFEDISRSDVQHPLLGAGLGGGHWPVIREIITHRIGPDTVLWTLPTA